MQRRRALLGAAAAGTAPVAILAAPALAQSNPEVRWRMSSAFPRNLDVLFGTGERIAQRVAGLTENRFQIRFFPAGEVVPGFQVLDAVQANTIEAGHTPVYYYIGKDPSFAFFTALPFGLNARQNLAWMQHGGGNALAAELFRDFSIVGFPAGDTGAQMGGWFRNEIRTVEELRGLKFRIAGLAGQVFQRLGAVPTQVPAADIYPSLERGTLDAVEFVGPPRRREARLRPRRPQLLRAGLLGSGRAPPPHRQPARLRGAARPLQGRAGGGLRRGGQRHAGPLRPPEPAGAAALGRGRRAAPLLAARDPPGRVARAHGLYEEMAAATSASAASGPPTAPTATSSTSGSAWRRTPSTTSPSRRPRRGGRATPARAPRPGRAFGWPGGRAFGIERGRTGRPILAARRSRARPPGDTRVPARRRPTEPGASPRPWTPSRCFPPCSWAWWRGLPSSCPSLPPGT
jgi:hypothetical protein